MSRRRQARAFTLVELLVSLAVSAVVLALMMGIVLGQKKSLEGTEGLRGMDERGKDALVAVEQHLREAGFGVDPRDAFDFNGYACPAASTAPCRDQRTGPDELVFLERDPMYRVDLNGTNGCADVNGCPVGNAWRLESVSLPTITIAGHAGDKFVRGQVLLAVCPNGYKWTMSTVATSLSSTADGDETLTLATTDATKPYLENAYDPACFGTGATVFMVNRYAYSIQTFGGVPWLMLDTGLDLDGDGSTPWTAPEEGDLLPIAPDVEDLQVAYVLDRSAGGTPPDSNADDVVGDDASSAATAEQPDPAAAAPLYETAPEDPLRRNLNPANIRAVRVSLVIRGDRPDPSHPVGWPGHPLPLLENSSRVLTPAAQGGFRRFAVSTTVTIRNLDSRGMFVF